MPSRWIVGPAFDVLVFIGSAAVTLIPWVLVDRFHVHPFYILAGVAIGSNGPHLASTWMRVYLDGEERFRRPLHYWLAPALLFCGVLAFIFVDGFNTPWLRTVLFYWASWHFAAQCWGLLRIYQRKHGVVDSVPARLEKVLLFGGAGWCVLHRVFTGPWELFGVPIWHPSVRAWQVNAVGASMVLLSLIYLGGWALDGHRAHSRYDARRAALVAASVSAFAVPFLLIRNGTAAFAAAAAWHGIQYIGIVWFHQRNRFRGGVERRSRLVSFVAQPGRWPLYMLTLLALAGAAYATLLGLAQLTHGTSWDFNTWGLLVWTGLTFSHYYLDGVIWKLRRDRVLTERLEIAAAA